MRKIRIGKDIEIRWTILTNGSAVPLDGRDLRLQVASLLSGPVELGFSIEGEERNIVIATFRGTEQKKIGSYRITLWENFDKDGQTAVDYCEAFALVSTTCEETEHTAGDLETETVDLGSSDLALGMPGADGKSAYEIAVANGFIGTESEWLASLKGEDGRSAYDIFKEYNPDSELTEEQYAKAPIEAAQGAENAIKAVEETNRAVTDAEAKRVRAENARVSAEKGRVSAESERVKAEAFRVHAEANRETAEVEREQAETEREQSVNSALSNVSSAIKKAESATSEANTSASRANSLADNPPKIVDGYWAFWNEATGQYVTSEYPAQGPQGEPGEGVTDAVRFSEQSLSSQQQMQARANIGAASESVIGDISALLDELNGETV